MKKFALTLCALSLLAGVSWAAAPQSGKSMEISGSKVNLRSAPTTKSQVVTQMELGDVVTALEEITQGGDTWYRVRTAGGQEGWAFGKYVRAKEAPAAALSDAEYREMMKDPDFANAEKKLTQVWNKAKEAMPKDSFERMRKAQRAWVAKGRDEDAKDWMESGLSRVKAYAAATDARADELQIWLDEEEAGL